MFFSRPPPPKPMFSKMTIPVIIITRYIPKNILTIRLLVFIVTKDLIFFYNKLILVLFMGQVNKKSDNPEV